VTLTAHAALPYGYPTTARPPVRQCRASRHQSEPGFATGPIAVHVDRDHGSCLPLRTRTPAQNPRAIAFCLVPLAMTRQFSVPGATVVFTRLASASDRAFGGVLRGRLVEAQTFRADRGYVDGRWWIISDEYTHGVFRERLRPEFVTAWEAESQAIASKEAGTLEDVEARLRVLESEREQLIRLRTELKQAAREVVTGPARVKATIRSRSKGLPKGRRGRRHPAK
jgi:hypothetical protein